MLGANQRLTIRRAAAPLDEESEPVQPTRDAHGRKIVTFEEVETVVAGTVWETASRELVGPNWVQVQRWKAVLPPDTEVNERDVIVDSDGTAYRVETVVARRSPWGVHHINCQMTRVEQ
jgi:hypothetical protein